MTHVASQLIRLVGKDLRIEARSRQTLGLVLVLGVLIVVVLALGLGPQQVQSPVLATSVLWVAYLFGGVMCFEKTMAMERDDGAMVALLLTPVDRGVIYLAKLISNLLMMTALALVVTPVAIVLLNFNLGSGLLPFIGIMALSFIGLAALGTMLAAATSGSRLQGGLLAIVVLPVCLPLIVTSTQLSMKLFGDGQTPTLAAMGVLIAFDVIYLVISWLVFEWVLEP
jgi:heme exporter protein B